MVMIDSDGNPIYPEPNPEELVEQATEALGNIVADMAEDIANGKDPK